MAYTPMTAMTGDHRPARRGIGVLTAALAAALAMTACSSDPSSTPEPSGSTTTSVTGTITVFAAASLTDVFEDIAEDFEAANPGAQVEFDFAGSSGGPGEASADITPAGAATLRLEPGQRLWAAVKATETRAYPAG